MLKKYTLLSKALFLAITGGIFSINTASAQEYSNIIPSKTLEQIKNSNSRNDINLKIIGDAYTTVSPIAKQDKVNILGLAKETVTNAKKKSSNSMNKSWEKFRKESWWLWEFFKDRLSYREQQAIKENLEEQKKVIKDYLEDTVTLFDVYEVVFRLEPYIDKEKIDDFHTYSNNKIDILQQQKEEIMNVKKNLAFELVKETVKVGILKATDKNIEKVSNNIIDNIKSLPEEQQSEVTYKVIDELNKQDNAFASQLKDILEKQFIMSSPEEKELHLTGLTDG